MSINLCKGETTNERLGKMSYKKQFELIRESMDMDYKRDESSKVQYNVMGINDLTSRNNSTCSNILGMCCSGKVMVQDEILEKTKEAYGVEDQLRYER